MTATDRGDRDVPGWRALRDLVEPPDPTTTREERLAANLRESLALFEDGVGMMRKNLERAAPGASGEEIEARLREWLAEHPGAPDGDGPGRPALERLRRLAGGGA